MSLQTILSICESVGINDQRFVGQTLSRNQKLVTSEILTVVPFQFELRPMNYLLYSQNRTTLNSLRIPDKSLTQYLNFGQTGWLNYVKYQGQMTAVQIGNCLWQVSSANKTLVLGALPALSSTDYLFRVGDFVQVGLYSYIVTADVQRGSGSTVNVPIHRNLLVTLTSATPAVAGEFGTTVSMGGTTYTGVTFPVVLREYPTYNLVPITNDSFISWSGSFQALEQVL
jgi:hypothetical protein